MVAPPPPQLEYLFCPPQMKNNYKSARGKEYANKIRTIRLRFGSERPF
jgi:hypothetical protein